MSMGSERRRGPRRAFSASPVRETALARLSAASSIRSILADIGPALSFYANRQPVRALRESLVRAELRAAASDLRSLQDILAEVAHRRRVFDLPPSDCDLCKGAAEWSREVAIIAVRIERRLGPVPPAGVLSGPNAVRKRYRLRPYPPPPVRAIALFRFSPTSPVRSILENIADALALFAAQLPVQDLSESLVRAELRAAASDLRTLEAFLARIARPARISKLAPADRDLCVWAVERAREVAPVAARIERRLALVPVKAKKPGAPSSSPSESGRLDEE